MIANPIDLQRPRTALSDSTSGPVRKRLLWSVRAPWRPKPEATIFWYQGQAWYRHEIGADVVYVSPTRIYVPEDGRFVERDPLVEAQATGKRVPFRRETGDAIPTYSYVSNSPALAADPSGLIKVSYNKGGWYDVYSETGAFLGALEKTGKEGKDAWAYQDKVKEIDEDTGKWTGRWIDNPWTPRANMTWFCDYAEHNGGINPKEQNEADKMAARALRKLCKKAPSPLRQKLNTGFVNWKKSKEWADELDVAFKQTATLKHAATITTGAILVSYAVPALFAGEVTGFLVSYVVGGGYIIYGIREWISDYNALSTSIVEPFDPFFEFNFRVTIPWSCLAFTILSTEGTYNRKLDDHFKHVETLNNMSDEEFLNFVIID